MRLHDLAERPERDAVPVGKASALPPVHELRAIVHPGAELREQPGLAHARLARDRHELDRRVGEHALERVLQQAQLALAPHERRRRSRLCVDAEPARRRQRSPGGNGVAFALELERRNLFVADCLRRRASCLLVDDEASHRRCSLEAGGRVDDVAGGDSLPGAGLGAELHDGLAGRDGGPHGRDRAARARSAPRLRRGSAIQRAPRARDRPRGPPARRRPPSRRRRRTSRPCRRSARSRARLARGTGAAWRGRLRGRPGRRLP